MSSLDYPRIFARVFTELWLIDPAVHYAIQDVLLAHLAGETSQITAAMQLPASGSGDSPRIVRTGNLTTLNIKGIMSPGLSMMERACGGYDTRSLESDVESIKKDGSKRVLLRVDSPGGNTVGIPEGAQLLADLGRSKDLYAVTEGSAGSAAYWWASQAKKLYVTPTARVGSIGVYTSMLDRSEEMKMRGQRVELFKAGKFKAMGYPGTTLTDEERALVQSHVDDSYAEFTKAVKQARPQVPKSAMEGQVFRGKKAVQAGLADGVVGSVSSLVNALSV